jgi:hypothetical protein
MHHDNTNHTPQCVPQTVLELEPGSRAEEWHQHPLGGGGSTAARA